MMAARLRQSSAPRLGDDVSGAVAAINVMFDPIAREYRVAHDIARRGDRTSHDDEAEWHGTNTTRSTPSHSKSYAAFSWRMISIDTIMDSASCGTCNPSRLQCYTRVASSRDV
jgi:hypothetical protein